MATAVEGKAKQKVQLKGTVVAGGKVMTGAGLRYTFSGKDAQWAQKNVGKEVAFELDVTANRGSAAGGAARLASSRRGER